MKKIHFMVLMVFCAVVWALPSPPQAPVQEASPWDSLQFLVGSWSGVGSGQPGEAVSGATRFGWDLDKKVLIRKNRAEYAPKAGEKKNVVHDDLMVFYQQAGEKGLRAIYFDNEGHVIRYAVTVPAKTSSVILDSDPAEKGPRFRLVYDLSKEGVLSVEFLIGPPGGELKSYTKGILKRAP